MIRTLSRPQLAFDVCLAVLLLIVSLPFSVTTAPIELIALFVLTGAAAVRRLSPTIALGVAWLGAVLQMLGGSSPMLGDVAILMVLYATARYGTPRLRWIGLGSAGVGAVIATVYLVFWLPMAEGIGVGGLGNTLFISAFAFVGSLAVLVLSWTFGLVIRLSAQGREARVRQAAERSRREMSERAVIVEQERNQIARDMHDVVAHSLAVVIAQADGARYAAATNPDAATAALGTIAASARSALGEVRVLLTALRHREGEGPQPGLSDLEALFEQLRAAGLDVRIETTGVPLVLGIGNEIAAYRIVQEALTNALRHGQSGVVVWVRLDWWHAGLAVTVDNALRLGAPQPPATSGGHGLPGMRERASLAGGTFACGTVDGTRYRVTAMIPAHGAPGGMIPA